MANLLEVKQKAGRFCAFRERSPKELLDKLQDWGLSEEAAVKMTAELTKEKFVDEGRFAKAYCNDKFEFNSWGRIKIRQHIYPHRISESVLEEALNAIDPDRYFDRLVALATSKWEKTSKDEEYRRKQKTAAFLVGKGFEMDLVWSAIEEVLKKGQ